MTCMMVSFATNEFPEYFSPFRIFDIETGPLFTKLKTSYLKISKVLYNNRLFWDMTGELALGSIAAQPRVKFQSDWRT